MEGYHDNRGSKLGFDCVRRKQIGQQLCVIPFGVWLLEGGRAVLTSGSAASGWSTGLCWSTAQRSGSSGAEQSWEQGGENGRRKNEVGRW